jgi:HAD superfamily phosphoserine phosphatase-like hydrolase
MEKVVVFDLDGTLIKGTSWVEFNQSLGLTESDAQYLSDEYKKGTLSYTKWIDEIVTMYRKYSPVHKEVIEALGFLFPIREGAEELIAIAKEKGYTLVLLSGGVDTIVKGFAGRFGIDNVFTTNELVFDEEGYLQSIVTMGDEAPAKVALLQAFCEKRGVDIKEVLCVGDGGNNVELFKFAKGIQLGNYEELAKVAWKQVGGLKEIETFI